jgi:hypothetical protein
MLALVQKVPERVRVQVQGQVQVQVQTILGQNLMLGSVKLESQAMRLAQKPPLRLQTLA